MSRRRTRPRSALTLFALTGLLAGCGAGSGDSASTSTDPASAAPDEARASTLREADFPEYTSTKDAFVDIAKRIVGIDPTSPTGQVSYYGLVTLADELGYGWTWNSCGTNWDVTTPPNAVVLTSNHQTGTGYSCDDGPKRDDPAKYTLQDWFVADASAVKIPYTTASLPAGVQATVNKDGEIEVITPTVVTVDTGLNPTSQNVKVTAGVDTAIAVADSVTRGWSNTEEAGVSVEASTTVGLPGIESVTVKTSFSFKYSRQDNGSATKMTTTTVTPKCAFELTVPPSCHYTGTITVSKSTKAAQYKAYVVAKPQTAVVSGFMRYGDSHGCMRRGNKGGGGADIDGHCKRDHVDETFGGGAATGLIFYQDIERQRLNDSGNWYWHLMSGIADYTHGGKADVDSVIDNLRSTAVADSGVANAGDRAYQFSVPFTSAHEDLTTCVLKVAVAPDSTGDCKAPPPASKPAVTNP